MNATGTEWPTDVASALGALRPGHAFTVPDVMFAKIRDEQRDAMQAKFAGEKQLSEVVPN
jgi:methionyl-tRNA synthetase